MLSGRVTDFSDATGLGTVTTADGHPYLFHVVEIADGSRRVETGEIVTFQPLPKFGKLQAGKLRKVRSG